jgi:hypothetical protein
MELQGALIFNTPMLIELSIVFEHHSLITLIRIQILLCSRKFRYII